MKVLIIQQKMIGDVLTSSILFEIIKEKHPDYELHYLINSHTFPVVEHNPYIDKFIFYTPEIENSKKRLFSFLNRIKSYKYDIVIDAYSKLSSNLITWFSKAPTKISKYKSYTAFLYDNPVNYKSKPSTNAGLAIENRLQLLEPLGITTTVPVRPKIYLTVEEKEKAKLFLESHKINLDKPVYMISVLGSSSNKTYPFEYMAKVLDELVTMDKEAQILFNYIPKQKDDALTIFNSCQSITQAHIHFNVFGKNLRAFLAITSHCKALIGNEGGAVNMAKALQIPTFTIFSPWIKKEDWSVFENGTTNVSVHLKDFNPSLYEKPEKSYKMESEKLYKEFKPSLFINNLQRFVTGLTE